MSTFTIKTAESSYKLFDEYNTYNSCKDSFTFEAFERILENEEELAVAFGDEDGTIDFDPVRLNSTYSQYDCFETFLNDYRGSFDRDEYIILDDDGNAEELDTIQILEDLQNETWAIELDDGSILFQTF